MSDGHLVKPVNLRELEKVLAEVRGLPPRCVGAARESSGGAVGGPAAGRLGASSVLQPRQIAPVILQRPCAGEAALRFSVKGTERRPRLPRTYAAFFDALAFGRCFQRPCSQKYCSGCRRTRRSRAWV